MIQIGFDLLIFEKQQWQNVWNLIFVRLSLIIELSNESLAMIINWNFFETKKLTEPSNTFNQILSKWTKNFIIFKQIYLKIADFDIAGMSI